MRFRPAAEPERSCVGSELRDGVRAMSARVIDKPKRQVTEGPYGAPSCSYPENVKRNENQKVVFSHSKAISTSGGLVGGEGSPAPGAIAKVAGMKTLQFSVPARVSDCEGNGFGAVENREYKTGAVGRPAAKLSRIPRHLGALTLLLALACGSAGPASARDMKIGRAHV